MLRIILFLRCYEKAYYAGFDDGGAKLLRGAILVLRVSEKINPEAKPGGIIKKTHSRYRGWFFCAPYLGRM